MPLEAGRREKDEKAASTGTLGPQPGVSNAPMTSPLVSAGVFFSPEVNARLGRLALG